ncbi:MAG TPA: DHA2 family efflux MFS transporter permease subunit [Candidatus Dormibacteraeota bacterium]|nr:DHA2 family efflux MFS transporter permease subunit [Candidatus Dormibacteraeota bacterium]
MNSERVRNPWLALVVLCLGVFMIVLDLTIVNVALPTMIDSLHASLDQILWVVNAYTLTFAVLLVTGSRLGDILGQRNLFGAGLAIFTIASAACGLAQDPGQLIAARALQGVGAAVLSPQGIVIISAIFPADRRGAAFGILSGLTGLASVLGPTLGGLLIQYLDWRWIFFVNLPIGIAAIGLSFWLVPDLRPGKRHRLDLGGVALLTGGLFGAVFGLVEGQRYDWGAISGTWLTIPEVLAAGVILIGAFVAWEAFQREPLLPLSLFRNRNYSLMVWLTAVINFGLLGLMLVTTIDLQSVLGYSALKAGLTITPLTVALMVVAPFAGRLTDRFGARFLLLPGFLLCAAGAAGIALLESTGATWVTFILPLAAFGTGMGLVFAPSVTEAMREVPPALSGAASGMLNTSRQVGATIGAAVIGAVLQNQLGTALRDQAVAASTSLPPQARASFVAGFANAARQGLQVGPSQAAHLPPAIAQLAHDVFVTGYSVAMRPTLLVAATSLLLGAISCALIASPKRAAELVDVRQESVRLGA